MATVDDLLDRLQARGYGTDNEATQTLLLDVAWSRFQNLRRWKFLETTEQVVLAASDTNIDLTVDLTGNVKHLDAVRIVDKEPPRFLPVQEFYDRTRDTATGTPRFWTRRADELLFWPTPTESLTLNIDYIALSPALSTLNPAVDDIPIPTPYEDLLVLDAIKEIAFRERDWDARQAAHDAYGVLYSECLAEHGMDERQWPTTVKQSGFYDAYDAEGDSDLYLSE